MDPPGHTTSATRYSMLRIAISVLLVITAFIKLASPHLLLGAGGLLSGPSWFIAAVVGELTVAYLVIVLPLRRSWQIAWLTFLALTMTSLYAWNSDLDCNCFGAKTPRGLPLLINLACLFGLAVSKPAVHKSSATESDGSSPRPFKSRVLMRSTGLMLVFAAGCLASVVVVNSTSPTPGKIPDWFGENLVGHRFPLYEFPEFADLVKDDKNLIVMLFRPDCEHCRQLAEEWSRERPQWMSGNRLISVVISPNNWLLVPDQITATEIGDNGFPEIAWEEHTEPFVASTEIFKISREQVTCMVTETQFKQGRYPAITNCRAIGIEQTWVNTKSHAIVRL